MAKKRQRVGGLSGLDPAIAELRKGAAVNKAALSGKQQRDRERVRVRYDVDLCLKKAIEAAASSERISTSYSQFAEILLAYAYAAWQRGDLDEYFEDRIPSKSPRFRWDYGLSEELSETFEEFC